MVFSFFKKEITTKNNQAIIFETSNNKRLFAGSGAQRCPASRKQKYD